MRVFPFLFFVLPALVAAKKPGTRRVCKIKPATSTFPAPSLPQQTASETPTPSVPPSTATATATRTPSPVPTSTTPPTSSNSTTYELKRGFPSDGIRGVNFGSYMLIEPWMMEEGWKKMGGDICGSCFDCVGTEFDLVQKLGQDAADAAFATHWDTFLTKDDVDLIKQYNLNSVRIPLGFWIIEETVNADEHYPRGGLDHLRKMCGWLADAGVTVLLDMHAAPGGSTSTNAFAGRCVNPPQFWGNEDNVSRHLAAAAKLAEIVHKEPEHFRTVWGLEALNEPPQDGSQTPGYSDFLKRFVQTVRKVETDLSIPEKDQIVTVFMDKSWQWQNPDGNPADAARNGSAFDAHMYTNWGGAGGPVSNTGDNIDQHIRFACQGDGGKIGDDTANFNTPSFRGEFWLLGATTDILSNDDIENVKRWGDAQKMAYMPQSGNGGGGWYFWSWFIDNPDGGGYTHMRSYKDAVAKGYLHQDAAQFFYPNVCKDALGQ